MEIKPVVYKGQETYYTISEYGNVWSKKTKRHLKHIRGPAGYPQVSLRVKDKTVVTFVHHLVASAFIGERPPKHMTHHKDNNKLNNHYSNLAWVRNIENSQHARDEGWYCPRECKGKLHAEDVHEIRRLMDTNKKQTAAELGRRYKVSAHQIGLIARRQSWSTLPEAGINTDDKELA